MHHEKACKKVGYTLVYQKQQPKNISDVKDFR